VRDASSPAHKIKQCILHALSTVEQLRSLGHSPSYGVSKNTPKKSGTQRVRNETCLKHLPIQWNGAWVAGRLVVQLQQLPGSTPSRPAPLGGDLALGTPPMDNPTYGQPNP